ncbi:MAG: hypothetical protein KKF46_00500 [Nanoarchaeota archaeon]|nr:hypothetical protein [Nanoarchaeota archaeon]MBU1320814.1 hypothetical protein [Nanoarchaeota archaeon]MBU1596824.1 hypothetical protein [Nanoarchaeota archaeon]MBU2440892.1 hypothetical protein [Nanoarchaeota archaeon]
MKEEHKNSNIMGIIIHILLFGSLYYFAIFNNTSLRDRILPVAFVFFTETFAFGWWKKLFHKFHRFTSDE